MPTQTTFHTEASREAFRVLRDELNALLGESTSAPSTSEGPPPQPEPQPSKSFREEVRDLGNVHPNLRQLAKFLVDNYPDREFTWDDVARDMGRDVEGVKSWHRSLSKWLNDIARRQPSLPRFFSRQHYDGSPPRNHYTVAPEWREAIQQEW
jgi:hypothetical protein